MRKKQKESNLKPRTRKASAGQDFFTPSKQDQFPGMGKTLSSYQGPNYRSNDKNNQLNLDKTKKKRRFFKKPTLKKSIITLLILFVAGGAVYGGKLLYELHKTFGGSIFGILSSDKLKGEDSGRVNIILAGLPGQTANQGGVSLTDSIMVVSLDTKNNTGWLLSVPRDLYVNIPSNGYSKLNAVYEDGQNNNFSQTGYPNGGVGLLEKILSQKLGIPIDYYAVIDYNAFKDAVNAVGGVSVDIQSSDPRGLYDAYTHLRLANGNNYLNGQEALNLARARGDDVAGDISYGFPESDFDRTMHQRQLLVAIKTKATSTGVLANPIKISNLFSALGNNIKTDLSLGDAHTLYNLSTKIPNGKIASLSLNSANGQDLLTNYTDSSGQEDLVPAAGLNNYSDIQAFVAQHTSNNPLVQEDASVVVLNGTDTDGLAKTYQDKLQSDHIDASQIGDADSSDTTTSEIIDASKGKDPNTKKVLVQMFGSDVSATNPYSYQYPNADFIVVVGNDKVTSNSSTND
jgi:LCP family protein required for cell wall assembly